MIEEFKVSLFAQELGTPYPVSEKRLDKKWREIETHQY
jgi:ATP-dependent helicase HrpA